MDENQVLELVEFYEDMIEKQDEIIEEIYQSYTIVDEFVEKPILIEEIMK